MNSLITDQHLGQASTNRATRRASQAMTWRDLFALTVENAWQASPVERLIRLAWPVRYHKPTAICR